MSRLDTLRLRLADMAPPARLRAVLPGLVALAVSAELFACLGPAAISRRLAADTAGIAAQVEEEDTALRRRLHKVAEPAEALREVDPVTFLRQLRTTAAHGTAGITRLAPRAHDARLLDVELVASFPAFLDLATQIERLGARLQGVRIRPAQPSAQDRPEGTARQAVSFTLAVPRKLAAPPPDAAAQAAQEPRDPFAPIPEEDGAALSRRFALTGLTRTATGPMATINNRDYAVGDRLDDLTITAIGPAEVSLASGPHRFRLRLARPD